MNHETWLWGIFCDAAKPPSRLPAWKWAEDNIDLPPGSPVPGHYSTALTPFARLVYEAAQNPRSREVTAMVAAQFFKSQFLINFFLWCLENDPGETMWTMASSEMCEEFIETRLKRALMDCAATRDRMPMRRNENKKDLVQFPSMNLFVRGSNSRIRLQSTPVRRLICDERSDWKPGAIVAARGRQGAYHNAQEISAGTAGMEDDEFHRDWKRGSQTVAAFRCLACNHSQPWRMGREPSTIYQFPRARGGLRWSQEAAAKPGTAGWEQVVMDSVRWECEECGHLHTRADKVRMVGTMHGIDLNPAASVRVRSFQSPIFPALWEDADWGKLAVEFLRACQARDGGDLEPLKGFVQRRLCEPWRDTYARPENSDSFDLIKLPYGFNDAWPEEVTRFMAVDCQGKGGDHYWWAIRSISATGSRRLVAYGRALTPEQLLEIQAAYKVPTKNCVIDHGYKGATVARWCAASGWRPFKGEEDNYFTVKGPNGPVRRPWTSSPLDPQLGHGKRREITLFRWSNPWFKEVMGRSYQGLVPGFSIPDQPGRDWLDHQTAEVMIEERDRLGVVTRRWKKIRDDDHLRDCELMILAAMHIAAHYGDCPHPGGK